MIIENGKIKSATELELYGAWLEYWSEIMDFNQYMREVQAAGTIITEEVASNEKRKNNLYQ